MGTTINVSAGLYLKFTFSCLWLLGTLSQRGHTRKNYHHGLFYFSRSKTDGKTRPNSHQGTKASKGEARQKVEGRFTSRRTAQLKARKAEQRWERLEKLSEEKKTRRRIRKTEEDRKWRKAWTEERKARNSEHCRRKNARRYFMNNWDRDYPRQRGASQEVKELCWRQIEANRNQIKSQDKNLS